MTSRAFLFRLTFLGCLALLCAAIPRGAVLAAGNHTSTVVSGQAATQMMHSQMPMACTVCAGCAAPSPCDNQDPYAGSCVNTSENTTPQQHSIPNVLTVYLRYSNNSCHSAWSKAVTCCGNNEHLGAFIQRYDGFVGDETVYYTSSTFSNMAYAPACNGGRFCNPVRACVDDLDYSDLPICTPWWYPAT